LVGQKTENDLRARLIRQPLYLRGQWGADKLEFDDTGQLQGTASPITFTLSGVEIGSVKLTTKGLTLEGQRVGLEFEKDLPKRVGLMLRDKTGLYPERMTIEVKTPVDGDFTAALDAIFTGSIAGLDDPLPDYWQPFARKHLLPPDTSAAPAASGVALPAESGTENPAAIAKPARIGGPVTSPRLLTHVEPEFDTAARAMKYSGIVLVNFVVDTQGKPHRFQILHPVGLGLDERAVAAVSQYTFQPATKDGSPVSVQLNVEVNFQIF
jgi:TonB family protein